MKQVLKRYLPAGLRRILTIGRDSVMVFFKTAFRLIGIDAFVRKPGFHYVPDYFGRAAHKQEDIRTLPLFGELAANVISSGRASLYYDRLYSIYQLLLHLKSYVAMGQKITLAEVGVYKGGTSYFIASVAERLGLTATHYAFDTFEGHAKQDINLAVDTSHRPATFTDTSYESVSKYLNLFGNVLVYPGRFQDTCHHLQNVRMYFVHLDMDIYEPTIFALQFFDKRLVDGGAILLDDYGFETCPGIVKAVEEFASSKSNYFGMSLLTGQYVLIKIKN